MGTGGHTLNDRYELDELIATGGMGEVWRGRDTLLGRAVAVKVLRSEYTGDPTFLARFRAEATHAAALSHPNIAAVYDYGEVVCEDDGEHLAYLVMELVHGEPLSTVLRERGALGTEATLSVLRQTAAALAEAHHVGLVHRDVKPGNILVAPGDRVKITDFGIAWSANSVPLTQADQVLGTPQYLSPEMAVGAPPTPACDVYSLGLVGYECLTGQPAFTGDNPVTVALKQVEEDPPPLPDDLPEGVRELVDVAVAKDPGARLPDGDAVVAAIDRVRAGESPTDTRPVARAVPAAAPRTPAAGRSRRLRTLLPSVAALLVGVGIVVALALTRGGADPAAADPAGTGVLAAEEQAVTVDGARYVGRPVDEVAAELAALGLAVDREPQVADGVPTGTVTALDAGTGALHPGDTVTVSYASGPAESTSGDAAPGAGSIGAATAPTQAAQAPSATVVPEPAPGPAGPSTTGTPTESATGTPTTDTAAGTDPATSTTADPATDSAAPSSDTGATPTAPTESAPASDSAAPSSDTGATPTAPTESAPASDTAAPSSDTGATPTEPAPSSTADSSAPAADATTPTGTPAG